MCNKLGYKMINTSKKTIKPRRIAFRGEFLGFMEIGQFFTNHHKMQFLIKTLPKLRALRIRSASRFTKTLLFQCSYRFYSTTQQDLLSKPRVKEASDKMLKAFNIVETSQNFKDSRRLLEESIAVLEEELPRNHALLGLAYNNLAQVLMRLHFMNYTLEDDSVYTYKEIIPLFETALKIFEEQTDNENFEFLQKRTILLNSFGVYVFSKRLFNELDIIWKIWEIQRWELKNYNKRSSFGRNFQIK